MDWINIARQMPISGSTIWAKDQRGNAVLGTCTISRSGACSLARADKPGVSILNVQSWATYDVIY